MITGTLESEGAEEGNELFSRTLVNALSFGQGVQMVEHLEQTGTGLMDGTNDCAATAAQGFQQRNTLETRTTVQTTVIRHKMIKSYLHVLLDHLDYF